MRIYAQLGTWPCWWRQGSPLKQACKLYEQLALDYFVVQPLAVMVIWWRYVVTKPHDISNAETWNPNVYTYSGLLWEYEKILRWLVNAWHLPVNTHPALPIKKMRGSNLKMAKNYVHILKNSPENIQIAKGSLWSPFMITTLIKIPGMYTATCNSQQR